LHISVLLLISNPGNDAYTTTTAIIIPPVMSVLVMLK